MALTLGTPTVSTVVGDEALVVLDVTFDSSYDAGGESLTPANLGLSTIHKVFLGAGNITTAFYTTQYDYTNKKLLAQTGGAQATGDLSTLTVRLAALGRR